MRISQSFALIAALLATVVGLCLAYQSKEILTPSQITASPFPLESRGIGGYGVEELQWQIQVFPGQPSLLNGTIQDVVSQALSINSAFALASSSEAGVPGIHSWFDCDHSWYDTQVICNKFPTANQDRIKQGIEYLLRLPADDRPTNGPGPGKCGRVSCSYNAAIWWCNDVSGS